MKTKTIKELHPRRFPSHKLTMENTLDGVAPWHQGIIERGTFFNKVAYLLKDGWQLKGWTNAPIARGDCECAIVFEKLTPPDPKGDWSSQREPGIYWTHGKNHWKIVTEL